MFLTAAFEDRGLAFLFASLTTFCVLVASRELQAAGRCRWAQPRQEHPSEEATSSSSVCPERVRWWPNSGLPSQVARPLISSAK